MRGKLILAAVVGRWLQQQCASSGKRVTRARNTETPRAFWPVLQGDLVANRAMVARLAAAVRTPDNRALSLLRADIGRLKQKL